MNNLYQRIITSAALIFILSISLFYNKYLWLFMLILGSLVLFIEFNNLAKKIWKKEKSTLVSVNIFLILFLIIFIFVGYELYTKLPSGLLFIILICIFSDTGGYIVEFNWWKKLTKISPKKLYQEVLAHYFFTFPIYFLDLFSKYSRIEL